MRVVSSALSVGAEGAVFMWEEKAIFSQLGRQVGKKSRFFLVNVDRIKVFDGYLYFLIFVWDDRL